MTPEQIILVKSSWAKVVPIAPTAAKLFYGKLFDLDPALRPLFKSDMEEQGKKLMRMERRSTDSTDSMRLCPRSRFSVPAMPATV
jgi:hypothetical protein